MKKRPMPSLFVRSSIIFCAGLLWAVSTVYAAPEHEFAGVKKCSICHKSAAQGEQFQKWQGSGHSKAFETLGTAKAKEAAAKLGIADPQTSGKCLKCHSTAYGNTTEPVTQVIPVEEGVSCESCHGPGKDYMKMSVMKDLDAAKAAGLKVPDETTCHKCHNEENPFNKPFNYQERWEKIKHPTPKK